MPLCEAIPVTRPLSSTTTTTLVFICNYSGTLFVPPAAAHEKKEDEAIPGSSPNFPSSRSGRGTPSPRRRLRPPAPLLKSYFHFAPPQVAQNESKKDFAGYLFSKASQAQRIAHHRHRRERHCRSREDGRILSQEWDER